MLKKPKISKCSNVLVIEVVVWRPDACQCSPIGTFGSPDRIFEFVILAIEVIPGALTLDGCAFNEASAVDVVKAYKPIFLVVSKGLEVDAGNEVLILVCGHRGAIFSHCKSERSSWLLRG